MVWYIGIVSVIGWEIGKWIYRKFHMTTLYKGTTLTITFRNSKFVKKKFMKDGWAEKKVK